MIVLGGRGAGRLSDDGPSHQAVHVLLESLFGEAKQWHGLRRFRLRGLHKVNTEGLIVAAGQNLKRLLRQQGPRKWPVPSALWAFLKLLFRGPIRCPMPAN